MKKVWVILLIIVCILQASCAKLPEATEDSGGLQPDCEYPTYFDWEDEEYLPEYPDETVWQEDTAGDNAAVAPDDTGEDTGTADDETIPDDNEAETVPTASSPAPTKPEQPTAPQQPETQPATTAPVQTQPATTPTEPPADIVKTDVAEPLTWAKLNGIPIAKQGMTEEQLRKICTDFMRLQLTFPWTPSENLSYSVAGSPVKLNAGSVYGGLPYVSSNFGNLYNAMEYYDEKSGMLNVDAADGDILKIIGNQCSASAYWAWSRISNAISYGGTSDMLEKNGCLRVGSFTYSDSINDFHKEKIRTTSICDANGEQKMYEAYALLLPADGISMYTGSAGHVRMVSEKAHVVRNSDGTINPERSCITFLDQISTWTFSNQSNGKPIKIQGGVDVTLSFRSLYRSGYLPFRIPELTGKDPVEEAEVSCDFTGATVSLSKLTGYRVSANYPISDVTVTVKNSAGKEIYRYTKAINDLNIYQTTIGVAIKKSELSNYANGSNTIEISCRVGTGEKLVAYTGKLTK